MILVFHGSRDDRHNRQAAEFAMWLGFKVAFMEAAEPRYRGEPNAVPIFIAPGADYEKAAKATGSKVPPLLLWRGFVDYLKGLGADVYIFHGPDETGAIRETGLPVAFLYGEPSLDKIPCPKRAAPVVLTRGFIYDRIVEKLARCQSEVLPPLFEQPGFEEFFKKALLQLI